MELVERAYSNQSISSIDLSDALAHYILTLLVVYFEAKLVVGTFNFVELDVVSCSWIFCSRY